eukprot:591228-Pelagomonas_calceolata.AAC.2
MRTERKNTERWDAPTCSSRQLCSSVPPPVEADGCMETLLSPVEADGCVQACPHLWKLTAVWKAWGPTSCFFVTITLVPSPSSYSTPRALNWLLRLLGNRK